MAYVKKRLHLIYPHEVKFPEYLERSWDERGYAIHVDVKGSKYGKNLKIKTILNTCKYTGKIKEEDWCRNWEAQQEKIGKFKRSYHEHIYVNGRHVKTNFFKYTPSYQSLLKNNEVNLPA